MNYKIAQLLLAPNKNANTICDIFIAQPDAFKEELAGKLFILIEISTKQPDALKISNFLISNINNNYYQNEKLLLREKISSLKVEHILEASLAKTNKDFDNFVEKEKINVNIALINITVGLVYDSLIHFANSGKNKAFFIYKHKINASDRTGEGYKITDIIKQSSSEDEPQVDSEKLFNNVISGTISPSSSFVFANEVLPEYIFNNELIEIVSTLPPTSASEQIKNKLLKINSYISFIAVIIKSSSEKQSLNNFRTAPASTQESIINLNKTEETTENLLAPSGVVNIGKWISLPFAVLFKKKNNPKNSVAIPLKDKIFTKRKNSWTAGINKIWIIIKNIFILINMSIGHIFKALAKKDKVQENLNKIKTQSDKISSKIKILNKKGKIFLFISVFFLILFSYNVYIIKIKNGKIEKQEEYNQTVAMIEQKQNQLEANMLYGNEGSAETIMKELQTLIDKLPKDTTEYNEIYKKFNEKFTAQSEKIRHVTRIDNIKKLADLVNLTSSAQPENIILLSETNKIYAADSGQKSIYTLDTSNNLITTATNLEQPIKSLKFPFAVTKNNSIIYLNDDSSVIAMNYKTEELKPLPIKLNNGLNGITGAAIYHDRLYVVDTTGNQILKYSFSGETISEPSNWVNDKTEIKDAVDIAIDGNIYLLKNNGDIIKFLMGNKVDFALKPVDPPLMSPKKMFTSLESNFICVLEPQTSRVVVFDKKGSFIMQYVITGLTNLKDFTIDEKNKIIYFLDGTSIYSTEATHLK